MTPKQNQQNTQKSKFSWKTTNTILISVATLLTVLSGCKKEKLEPDNPNTTEPKKHNVELVYGFSPSTDWQNISLDTLYKYNSDISVDSIFMIPENSNQYSTFSTNQLNTLVSKLRERHNVNPKKVFGKGELQLKNESTINNPEIVRFFRDTLGYNVIHR